MLIVKSKYKIAKRLGASVFDQTQTQKFALSEARAKVKRRGRGQSDYGQQLLEKQRARYTYGLHEKQFASYVHDAMLQANPAESLHRSLEMRADNVLYRAGFASTRRAARQAVSHGHVLVNGKRTTTPSHHIAKGDKLTIRSGVSKSPLYAGLAESAGDGRGSIPSWLDVHVDTLTAEVTAEPSYNSAESGIDYATVLEFYSR